MATRKTHLSILRSGSAACLLLLLLLVVATVAGADAAHPTAANDDASAIAPPERDEPSSLRPNPQLDASTARAWSLSSSAPSPPNPPLDSDLKLDISAKLFQPWGNDSMAVEGSSYAIGASVAHVRLGPCVYRAFHWHAGAWEIFSVVHGDGPVRSLMIEPGQEQRVREDTLRRGDSVAYPGGWAHYQLNDGCKNVTALLVWNAVHSGGVNNVPQQIAALPHGYREALLPYGGRPPRQGYWLRDPECARRCGLSTTGGEEVGQGEEEAAREVLVA